MILIDTDAFLSRFIVRDQFHESAQKAWGELRASRARCFTTNLILNETFTLLGRRAGHTYAAERARQLLTSRALVILRASHEDEVEAVEVFEKFGDQQVSFTDSVSFVLMRSQRLIRAFTFDEHFALAGFEVWPGRS